MIKRAKKIVPTKLLKGRYSYLLKSRYSYFTIGNWTAYLLQLLITFILTYFFDWWYMLSYATALLLGTLILFFYHENVTFKTKHPVFKENSTKMLLKFLIWAGLLILISWLIVFILAYILGMHYLLAIILTGPILSLFNYYVNKKWVFQDWKPKRAAARGKKNNWLNIKNLKIYK